MSKTGEIFIYDIIGTDWWTGDGVTAKGILQQLKSFNADKSIADITVRINSPGGSVFEGTAIYNLLQQNEKPVNTIIDGIAYSMAAIIAMSGKTRSMAKNATMLIHNCSGVAFGNVRDMKSSIEMMEKIDKGLAESIAETTGLTVAQVETKWMNYDDHTLTAREAKDAKLINEVLDYSAEIPAGIENMSTQELFALYAKKNGRETQETFIDKVANKIKALITPETNPGHTERSRSAETQNPKPETITDMNFKNSLELLDKATLTAEDATAIKAEITAFTGAAEKFSKAEVDAQIKAANETLQASETKLTADLNTANTKIADLEAKLALAPSVAKEETVIDESKKTQAKGSEEWNKPEYSWNQNASKL